MYKRQVLRLARFNLTKISEDEEWKLNFFEGVPSPAGAGLALLPLVYELSELKVNVDFKSMTPFFVLFVALLLISKVPTFSLKKIKISSQLTIFLLFGIVIIFISLIFFTFESLLVIGAVYLFSIPVSYYSYKKTTKRINKNLEEDHEDIL